MRDRSRSSLTIWTRWPGLDFDLADAVAHLGWQHDVRALRLARQRLGKEAHGRERCPELVREVVDEFGPDPLQPAELGDIVDDQPQAAACARRASTVSIGPSASARRTSVRAVPLARAACAIDSTDASRNASITRSTHERARRPAEERVGGRVRRDDAQAAIHAHDPGAQRPQQDWPAPRRPGRSRHLAAPRPPEGAGSRPAIGSARDALRMAIAGDDDRDDGQPQADDDPRVHGSSIAQPAARRSGERGRPVSRRRLRRPTRAPHGARRGMSVPEPGRGMPLELAGGERVAEDEQVRHPGRRAPRRCAVALADAAPPHRSRRPRRPTRARSRRAARRPPRAMSHAARAARPRRSLVPVDASERTSSAVRARSRSRRSPTAAVAGP